MAGQMGSREVAAAQGEQEPMSTTVRAFSLVELLAMAGALIRGRNRADCPWCKRKRTVSFDASRGVYHCHGEGCAFSGGIGTLARELGLARSLSPAEREQLRRQHERADHAARTLLHHVQARRFDLLRRLRALGRAELAAHQAGADQPTAWDLLARVYRERPHILTELMVLENCGAAGLIRFLTARPEQQARMMNTVVIAGGVCDSCARFVEIPL